MRRRLSLACWWVIPLSLSIPLACLTSVRAQPPQPLAFQSAEQGTFSFDTGRLLGQLRTEQLAFGIHGLERAPSTKIAGRYGLMNVYRVFSDGKRYGVAGWEWPSRAERLADGSVKITSPADDSRPFTLSALYRWRTPTTLDVEIEVLPQRDLHDFEVFLASYLESAFTSCQVNVGRTSNSTAFMAADRSLGEWLMFPRDADAVKLIQDGRWQLQPHPVQWAIQSELARPLAVRRTAEGTAVLLMAHRQDCFAMAMPYETEGHYSVYLSLFGRNLEAGRKSIARARMVVLDTVSDVQAIGCFGAFEEHHEDNQ